MEMLQTKETQQINDMMTCVNNRKQNILHACAENKLNSLLTDICFEPCIDKDVLKEALNQSDTAGMTPLHICTDEKTIIKIIEKITSIGIAVCIDHVDKRQNNIIHVYAKRNFVYCIRKIFKVVGDDDRIRFILGQKNHNGNNPLMSCVFKNSTDALNFLLCTLFTMDYDLENNDLMRGILHSENSRGETLLGLILHYQQNMLLPETIALQMEKMCHTELNDKSKTMENLIQCLRSHVEPSNEVMCAIQEVEDSYKKSRIDRFIIWIKLFFYSFAMPSILMALDIAFDTLLVIGYFYAAYDVADSVSSMVARGGAFLEDTCQPLNVSSRAFNQSTLIDEQLMKHLENVPNEFTNIPRFYYSIAFLIVPWIFYGIEFFHSRHFTNTAKKVCINYN